MIRNATAFDKGICFVPMQAGSLASLLAIMTTSAGREALACFGRQLAWLTASPVVPTVATRLQRSDAAAAFLRLSIVSTGCSETYSMCGRTRAPSLTIRLTPAICRPSKESEHGKLLTAPLG
eukprot:3249728-Pleurochrysis_carterae.AAC.1